MCFAKLTKLRPVTTINIMYIIAILRQKFTIAGIKRQTIAARLQFRHIVVTLPIFVARRMMWIETEIVWTFETFLC